MKILIVDDSEDIRLLLESLLHSGGYDDVITAETAEKAFTILGIGSSVECTVDLILLDIILPGIDGIEAVKRIKASEIHRDIPIIMVTARADTSELERAFYAGAIDYIKKPVDRVEIVARVRSSLKIKEEIDRRKEHEHELENALSTIKRLHGLIPICSYCKKIRNDEGYWQQVEAFISDHSEAIFSHSICEECAREHFPEDDDE